MTVYALINAVAPSPVIKRHDFGVQEPPILAAAKGLRWIPDIRPAIASHQRRIEANPVPTDATELTYTVETDPAHVEIIAKQNARQRVTRQVDELRGKGDAASRLEAVEHIIKELKLWP